MQSRAAARLASAYGLRIAERGVRAVSWCVADVSAVKSLEDKIDALERRGGSSADGFAVRGWPDANQFPGPVDAVG